MIAPLDCHEAICRARPDMPWIGFGFEPPGSAIVFSDFDGEAGP
jgi:hypothetical protein